MIKFLPESECEQMNKQLRKVFPKRKSIDHLTCEAVWNMHQILNRSHNASLSDASLIEVFAKLFDEELLDLLAHILI